MEAGGSPAGGLFSPLSGLGWESYLEARLDSELSRSASFEQDLSLLVIHEPGLSPEKPAYKALAAAIGDFFNFRDLAFERGPDGFSIILPNMDADHGLRMAEEFNRKLGGRLFMGLSSRAGRLVDAARLTHEAGAALARAATEADSRIVAFRPDPDRYRIYLASKNL
jgi:GGDEF domain-containing protein